MYIRHFPVHHFRVNLPLEISAVSPVNMKIVLSPLKIVLSPPLSLSLLHFYSTLEQQL